VRESGVKDAALIEKVQAGDVRAVSRLISMIENDQPAGDVLLTQLEPAIKTPVIGITGYPGAGKSTLVDQLVAAYRKQGKKVGVLAVDSSSPVSGGALLGDRIRMQDHALDRGVFIRSMATRGQYGGVAKATADAVRVLQSAGFDIIVVETVGVGQAEVDIAGLAGTVVLVVAPGLGDEVQAMKAGLLEVAHIVAVNKADREGADAVVRDLQEWVPRVVRTTAITGEGLPELIQAIAEHQRMLEIQGRRLTS
jgi:LAO/AO transport system kinase